MALPTHDVKASQPYSIKLSFNGIARYAITEYVPDGTGWKIGKVIQADGNSADAQADVYDLTPLALGDKRLVAVGGNMSSATGEDDVSMTATFLQGGKDFYADKQSGKDTGGIVVLWSRTVFVGV